MQGSPVMKPRNWRKSGPEIVGQISGTIPVLMSPKQNQILSSLDQHSLFSFDQDAVIVDSEETFNSSVILYCSQRPPQKSAMQTLEPSAAKISPVSRYAHNMSESWFN